MGVDVVYVFFSKVYENEGIIFVLFHYGFSFFEVVMVICDLFREIGCI